MNEILEIKDPIQLDKKIKRFALCSGKTLRPQNIHGSKKVIQIFPLMDNSILKKIKCDLFGVPGFNTDDYI